LNKILKRRLILDDQKINNNQASDVPSNTTKAPADTPAAVPSDAPNDIPTTPSSGAQNDDVKPNSEVKGEEFPFKPIGEEDPKQDIVPPKEEPPIANKPQPKEEPQINVSLEKNTDHPSEGIIEVPDYADGIRQPHAQPVSNTPKINKYQSDPKTDNNHTPLAYTFIGLVCICLGLAGGYFGGKYFSSIKTSADTNTTSANGNITAPKSTAAQPGDVSLWPSYTSVKYGVTIKYPDNSYAQNVNDVNATGLVFTSYDPANTTFNNGYKIEVEMLAANGKSLQDWITSYNTTSGNTAPGALTPVTVAGATAYQQTDTAAAQKSIATYLTVNDKVMMVTYSAPETNFATYQLVYDNLLKSIKI
jgi:hypothetical protein